MNGPNTIKNVDNKGISIMYKIFEEIYLKAPTFLKDLSNNSVGIDKTESIREQIDFKKIDTKFKNGEYCQITDVLKDIRTVFLNCYSFYGARSNHTKQSLELEKLLEEKISYLDKNYKLLADVNLTLHLLNMEGKPSSKLRYPKDCYDSVLLRSVAHCRPERLKKYHKTFSTTLTTNKDNAHILEKILSWENKVNFNDVFHQYISSMWELPEIGNFLAILFKKLDLNIINQGEIERMFLMPKESTTMGKVMTTLLAPRKKTKSIGPIMPYKVWSDKLSKKVSDWCKVYHSKKQNKVIAMDLLGIHPDFWTVVNEKNPLIEQDYSELSYFIKVWLVKGLCDYVTIKFKTINDIVTNCNERQCTIWKNDLKTEEYFFFDSMPDLRIYYYNIPYDEPCLEFLESVKTDDEVVQFDDKLTMNGFSEGFHPIQKGKKFKLIADSVESLRAFVYELDMEGKSVPESLISSLEDFIVNIEPKEYNYITMNNDSKLQLFKDWISYSDRIQKDKDNISVWEEKDSKSIAKTKNEELIIAEKRQRKLIVPQNVGTNESDEYVSENDKSLSDFTDSEDEWGAIYGSKFKVKQPQQTPSKLFLELEKRRMKAGKMLNHDTNQNDVKQLRHEDKISKRSAPKMCETNNKDESIKSVKLLKTQNKWKILSNNTNTLPLVNGNNKVKQPLQTTPKRITLEKQLRDKNTILKQGSIKGFDKKDKNIKSFKLIKTQNEIKCSNNTNTFVNGHNQILDGTKNIDMVCSNKEVVLIHSDKVESQKPPDGIRRVEVIHLDEDMQNDCEVFNDNSEVSTGTENKKRKSNKQKIYKQIESSVISIEDDDSTIISDGEDAVQFISMTENPKCSPLAKNSELIIAEKRQRKLIEKQNFNSNGCDEYVNEKDKSLSDFTDTKNELSAMSQPRYKVKQPQETASKHFLELEKRGTKAGKMLQNNKQPIQTPPKRIKLDKRVTELNKKLKVDTNDLLDTNQSDKRNQLNRTLVSSKNVSLLKEKDSKSIDQAKNVELIIAEKRQRKLIEKQNFNSNGCDEYVNEKDKSLSDFTDTKDELSAMSQPRYKVKQPQETASKHFLELEKRVTKARKMLKYDTNQIDVKQLRYEDKISKRSTPKMGKTINKDESIKSVILPKTQNEGKICSNYTSTLPLVNGNNKVKQPKQTSSKRIKLEKQLREESTILKQGSVKGFDKKDKNIKPFKLLKTQNEIKCSNNTNTFVNGHNQILVGTKNIDMVCSNKEVVLIHSDKVESQKPPDGIRRVEVIHLDEDMQNDCEVFNDNSEVSTGTENKKRKSNKQKNYKQIESSVISIEDDNSTIIIDVEDAVQFISMTENPKCSPLKKNKPRTLKTHLNKSYNPVSANRRIIPTNYVNHKAKSSIIDKLSQNVTIMPANVIIPKGIEVTMVKTPQIRIDSNFNSVKRKSTMSNGHPPDNPSIINVKCELISKPDLNGEVKFYVRLPNGEEHPGPNELINQYLKQHNNQLPDYWLVPLPVEVAKQYGFN